MEMSNLLDRALQGDAQAQRDIGALHAWGLEGFPKVDGKAREWFERAAAQGNAQGEYDLAMDLLFGKGGPTDVRRGVDMLKRSASHEQWDPSSERAAHFLSEVYRTGRFDEAVDLEQSERWRLVWRIQKNRHKQWHRGRSQPPIGGDGKSAPQS